MTTLPRHVVTDLLPLYLAGELSPETTRMVDEHLAQDPALAGQIKAATDVFSGYGGGIPPVAPDLEVRSIRRTRSVLALQRWLFGVAVGLTAVGLGISISVTNGRVGNLHLMVFEDPIPFGVCLAAGIGCWIGYWRLRRRIR